MKRKIFLIPAIALVLISLLHVVIAMIGGDLYRYFGAGEEMARMSEEGLLYPTIVTVVIAIVFLIMSGYAFSGAGVWRRLPLLRLGLVIITVIFLLRGVLVIVQMVSRLREGLPIVNKDVVFSLVALLVGIVLLQGLKVNWRALQVTKK